MSDAVRSIVIVGGGLAAGKAAESARAQGFDGTLTIVAEEAHRPYERPPLSKGYLLGQQELEETHVHPAEFYADHDIELHLGDPVSEFDRDAGAIVTRSGRRVEFDRLLLATGAAPRRLPMAGAELDGVMTLRTQEDSRALRERLEAVEHVTVIGAGWIGCEVAAAARSHGAQVTMVDPIELPLARVLGPEVARVFRDLHADNGVDLRLGTGASRIDGAGAVEQIALSDGSAVATQLVVVGIGVLPRVELAEQAGLEVDDGIVVDETLRSSDARIFAAGDVARAQHPFLGRRVRVEHWANALNQGETAGRNLAGADEAYDKLPYFYTDQYDLGMEYVGDAPDADEVVIRGSLEDREFIAFWLRERRVAAGMNVNVWDVVDDIQALIRSARPIDRDRLADPDVALADLAAP